MRWRDALVALVCSVVVAGCTGGEGGSPESSEAPLSSRVAAPVERTTVLSGKADADLALAASRALYRRAPAVLLAPDGDAATQGRAAPVAVKLGVPLLLAPRDGAQNGAAAELPAELKRLAPRKILSFGESATRWARHESPDASVIAASGGRRGLAAAIDSRLSSIRPPAPLDSLLVLVPRGRTAASATARAAGARVLGVDTPDPRADHNLITTLAHGEPGRVLALGTVFGPAERLRRRLDVAETGVELPGGGQVIFPGRRMVALYGHPGAPALGVLGEQPVRPAIARAKRLAGRYQRLVKEPVVPAFEIIATVASGSAGKDGDYSSEASVAALRPWVDAAGRAGVYVVLDLQPGRTDFLTQAKRYADLLAKPHVGLALDPEWRLHRGQRHLGQIGSVSAAEVNSVVAWLAKLSGDRKLPQKLLMLHQFRLSMIGDRKRIDTGRDELAVLIHADGFGGAGEKFNTWRNLRADPPQHVWWGWKNFYDEDRPMFTPARTVAIKPSPVFVSYQ